MCLWVNNSLFLLSLSETITIYQMVSIVVFFFFILILTIAIFIYR